MCRSMASPLQYKNIHSTDRLMVPSQVYVEIYCFTNLVSILIFPVPHYESYCFSLGLISLQLLNGHMYGRQKPSKVPFLNEIDKIEMN